MNQLKLINDNFNEVPKSFSAAERQGRSVDAEMCLKADRIHVQPPQKAGMMLCQANGAHSNCIAFRDISLAHAFFTDEIEDADELMYTGLLSILSDTPARRLIIVTHRRGTLKRQYAVRRQCRNMAYQRLFHENE